MKTRVCILRVVGISLHKKTMGDLNNIIQSHRRKEHVI